MFNLLKIKLNKFKKIDALRNVLEKINFCEKENKLF